jgi:hypothetical protein
MARFRDFKKSTVRETPDYVLAELRKTEIGNEAIAAENALAQEKIQTGLEVYDASTDMAGVTPIKDGFDRMFGSDGVSEAAPIASRDASQIDPLNIGDGGEISNVTRGETYGSDFDPQGNYIGGGDFEIAPDGSVGEQIDDVGLRDKLLEEANKYDTAIEGAGAAVDGAEAAVDGVDAATESAEALKSASTLGAGVDGLAAAAGNIPILGGISTLASAESPEQAAAELALMSNPYTGLLLSAYKMFS